MDFLRGIPVEHKLEAYNMPRTGPTLCHPKNWLCRNSALDTLVPISLLVHINEDNAYSPPKYQIQNYTVTLNTIPHTSSNTRCHHISLRHFASNTNKPKLHESCSTKSKPYSMLQIKTFFVVLLKKSFVIHLCCLKYIVLEKLTISQNAIIALMNFMLILTHAFHSPFLLTCSVYFIFVCLLFPC